MHAVTVSVSLRGHQSCCVWKTLSLESSTISAFGSGSYNLSAENLILSSFSLVFFWGGGVIGLSLLLLFFNFYFFEGEKDYKGGWVRMKDLRGGRGK